MENVSSAASSSASSSASIAQLSNWVDLIRRRANDGARLAFTFLPDGESEGPQLTYEALERSARAIAAHLQAQDASGRRALLFYPPGLEFVTAFCGCLFAGVVGVPVFPARRPRDLTRLAAIAMDSQASLALTSSRTLLRARELCQGTAALRGLKWLATDEIPSDLSAGWSDPGIDSQTLAFLQYTSGSTETPRGVMVTHGNLLRNSDAIRRLFGFTPDSLGLTWLPHFHDMGLIGGLLQPIYVGCASIVMPAASFLQRPCRWLQAVTRYRPSTIVAPNFAYNLCVRKIAPEERGSLKLDSVTVALAGAEPVRPETLKRFAEAFGPCGFRIEAFRPAYGLAEATLIVSGGSEGGGPAVCSVDADALTKNVVRPGTGAASSRALIGCGTAVPDTDVLIVDPETCEPCSGDRVGEIWVSGPGVAQGYWRRPEETEKTFHARLAGSGRGPFLRTGDLGFFHQGNLVVTGRLKDLIIIRGSNHYSQDLEHTVDASHRALRPGCGVAFAVDVSGEERLVIVHEVEEGTAIHGEEIVEAIRGALLEAHEVQAHAIVLIEPHSIFKTSSGKMQRFVCRQAFLESKLPVVFQWRQEDANEDGSAATERSGLVWDYLRTQSPARGAFENRENGKQTRSARKTEGIQAEQYEPIAIIGLGCRFPGAENLEALWRLLRDGKDAITEVPADRWDADALYDPVPGTPGKMNTRWGGFLEGIDRFDPHFFGIAPREASAMDPQQRLLLEVAWEALEGAGQAPEKLAGSKTGVFFGLGGFDYSVLIQNDERYIERLTAYAGTGLAHSIAANRLSYLLDLRGPSVALDTACSSSLVAIHLACQSLRSGQSDLALAGGVNLILSPASTVAFSHARMMAADGRCKTFDARADGYVRSEGCGVVVLKRLSEALRDRDNVLALLRGSAVNQDGRTAGISAPNGLAQQAVIRAALAQAGVEPSELTYLELHGTGTSVGDPIEVQAVKAVLGEKRPEDSPCLMGSVKANVGHLENASGMAGLAKVVLCLQYGQIPGQIQLTELNPRISLEGTRLAISRTLQPWPATSRRIAGVNSFGFGGTNAHITIEEPPHAARPSRLPQRPWHLFTLSARTPAALKKLALRYVSHLTEHPDDEIADLCFTANAGRSHFLHRLAVTARNSADLRQRLADFVEGRRVDEWEYGYADKKDGLRIVFAFADGTLTAGKQTTRSKQGDLLLEIEPDGSLTERSRKQLAFETALETVPGMVVGERTRTESGEQPWLILLRCLGTLYLHGATIDWDGFCAPLQPRKVCLPTYPFERERYWDPPPAISAKTETRDPLLGRRVNSPLPACQFETQLGNGDSDFLKDHRIHGAPVLPASAYLDMALSASREIFGSGFHLLEKVTFHQAARLPAAGTITMQLVVSPAREGCAPFQVFSRNRENEAAGWVLHVSGEIRTASPGPASSADLLASIEQIQARSIESGEGREFYAALRRRGLEYGPAFQRVQRYWRGTQESLAEISVAAAGTARGKYEIHPALLDACLQSVAAAFPKGDSSAHPQFTYLPSSLAGFRLFASPHERLFSHCVLRPDTHPGAEFAEVDIHLLDERGALIGELLGLNVRRVGAEGRQRMQPPRFDDSPPEILARGELLALEPAAQHAIVLGHLRKNMARLMGLDEAALDPEETLDHFGIDSLMAFELEDSLETSLRLKLPMDILMGMPSLNELAKRILALVIASEQENGPGALRAPASVPADSVEDSAASAPI